MPADSRTTPNCFSSRTRPPTRKTNTSAHADHERASAVPQRLPELVAHDAAVGGDQRVGRRVGDHLPQMLPRAAVARADPPVPPPPQSHVEQRGERPLRRIGLLFTSPALPDRPRSRPSAATFRLPRRPTAGRCLGRREPRFGRHRARQPHRGAVSRQHRETRDPKRIGKLPLPPRPQGRNQTGQPANRPPHQQLEERLVR